MTDFLIAQVPIADAARMAAEGWQVAERVSPRHGRYCVPMIKPIDQPERSTAMTAIRSIDPRAIEEFRRLVAQVEEERAQNPTEERERGIGLTIGALATLAIQHQAEIVAGLQLLHQAYELLAKAEE